MGKRTTCDVKSLQRGTDETNKSQGEKEKAKKTSGKATSRQAQLLRAANPKLQNEPCGIFEQEEEKAELRDWGRSLYEVRTTPANPRYVGRGDAHLLRERPGKVVYAILKIRSAEFPARRSAAMTHYESDEWALSRKTNEFSSTRDE